MIRCHPDQSDRRGGSKPRTMGTRRRKVDASARQPTAPGKQAFLFFLVPRRSLTTHISNSTRQPSQAAGALFEKLADAARGHEPRAPRPDPPMQPIVLGKRSRAPEARKAPAPAAGDRRCAHGKAHNGYYCKACNGKGICEHGKNRSICRACGGSQLCAHGMQRNQCKECNSPCEHGRPRRRCEACGGARAPEARKAPAPGTWCAHGKAHGYYCKVREASASTGTTGASAGRAGSRARRSDEAPAPAAGDRVRARRGQRRVLVQGVREGASASTGGSEAITKECGGSQICEHGRRRSSAGSAGLEHLRAREEQEVQGVLGLSSASTGGCEASARSAEEGASASTGGGEACKSASLPDLRAREAARHVQGVQRLEDGPRGGGASLALARRCCQGLEPLLARLHPPDVLRVRAQRVSEVFFERLK